MFAKATIVFDGQLTGVVPLDGDKIVFGRGAHGRSQLTDRTASKDHLLITRHGDALIASDLDSRHGTLLNRAPLLQPTRLQDRDVLILGRTEVRIAITYVGDTDTLPPRTPTVKLEGDELRIVKALAAPFRVPGALAPVPPSNKALAEAADVPPRTLSRRLDVLATKLRVPRDDTQDRSLQLTRRILEWGVDGQRAIGLELPDREADTTTDATDDSSAT